MVGLSAEAAVHESKPSNFHGGLMEQAGAAVSMRGFVVMKCGQSNGRMDC